MGVVEAMADTATVAVVVAEEAVVEAAADEDMVAAAAVAKTRVIIIIMIVTSMRPRRVTVRRHLLVEWEQCSFEREHGIPISGKYWWERPRWTEWESIWNQSPLICFYHVCCIK